MILVLACTAGALCLAYGAWSLAALRHPHGRHRRPAPEPVATDWGGDEHAAIWAARIRRSLSASGQAAELRIRMLVARRIVTDAERSLKASARAARGRWDGPAVNPLPLAARTRPEREAREAATGRPWSDDTGSFPAVAAGGQP